MENRVLYYCQTFLQPTHSDKDIRYFLTDHVALNAVFGIYLKQDDVSEACDYFSE